MITAITFPPTSGGVSTKKPFRSPSIAAPMLTEAYEIEIDDIPIDCKAWINLLERRYGQT
jgi:hypothetical protein